MTLEALVTRLGVTHRGELFVGLRNLGGVYFPEWKNLFNTIILGKNSQDPKIQKETEEKYLKVRNKIKKRPKLRGYTQILRRAYWWVLQLYCPIDLKDELPREFKKGNYTKLARWFLTSPGNYVPLDEDIYHALIQKNDLQKRLDFWKQGIYRLRKKGYATRTIHDIDQLFDNYNNNFQEIVLQKSEISSLKNLDNKFLEERKEISDIIIETNEKIKDKGRLAYILLNEKTKKRELRIEQYSYEYIKHRRIITSNSFFSGKYLLLDIEIPGFKGENPEITWVGALFNENREIEPLIYVAYNYGMDEITFKGFTFKIICPPKIYSKEPDYKLIAKLVKKVNKKNPERVSTYNTGFDLIKLRETLAGFKIGDKETNPIYKVTTPFFERIGIKDRFVIDAMRWQKIARAYEINAKIEMATGSEKTETYDEQEENEQKIIAGIEAANNLKKCTDENKKSALVEIIEQGRQAFIKNATYLAKDIIDLFGLVELKEYKKNIEDIIWMSDAYKIGFERLSHSTNCINDAQEKAFFLRNGIHREQVPFNTKTKKNQYKKTKAREAFTHLVVQQSVKQGEIKGLVCDVYKVYIPVGRLFRKLVSVRFPGAVKLYHYMDQFRDDKKRLFFLEQYAKEFSRWIVEDYGAFIKDVIKLDNPDEEFNPEEQKDRIISKGKSIIGNYGVFPSKRFFKAKWDALFIDDILDSEFALINRFLKENNYEIVAREGNYLYLTGKKEPLLREDTPLIIVDEIPRMYNADNPYYKKLKFFSHMKLKDEPDFQLSVFEMRNYKAMLENLLEGNNQGAIRIYNDALNQLWDEPVENLVYFNKSRNRFFAYDIYSKNKNKKTYFIIEERFIPEDAALSTDDETGFKYFEAELRDKIIRVYLRDFSTITPDIEKYAKRFKERGKGILEPVQYQENQIELF